MTSNDVSLGARVKRARTRRLLTQEQLAEKAQVSVDLVRKLEQEVRHTASMSSLTRLARALDIELPRLLGQAGTIQATVDEAAVGILAIRDELSALDHFPGLGDDNVFDDEPPAIEHLRSALKEAEHVRQHGSFAQLGAMLPGLMAETRAATRALSGQDQVAAYGLLSEVLQIASTMMTGLGKADIGYIGLIRAQEAAEKSDDELLHAMNVSALSWVFFKQGRLADAETAALRQAERMGPDFVRDPPERLAVWGILLLRAASAAVRDKRVGRSDEHLSLARAAAARIGSDLNLYATPFGPTNAGIAAVNAAVESEQFDKALTLAEEVPRQGWVSPTWRARHLLDLAIAHSELDHDEAAVDQLLAAERTAPEWLRYHTLGRQTVRELAERAKRRQTPVQHLADRLAVDV
ncbi:helix-turn-helix domain-containing protein [Actinokineospora sp. UTMC 2448]|uniref:helix-turn-helix domain-containing protein n=1 Tax=Actinokineospora sp. UTMC 2448 TaxID=2268449 RepID=UPI002164AC01|nr:helix-turn-helix domain-containing protein [Actinokineospora sp. UTMC 2448]UVS76340.1 anaerobic benzoate catabolism transcriptional regulator [Actinokineospora sp. UTMC 2448]